MTIARRILLLAGVTPLVLIALGVLNQTELGSIEQRSRFVAQVQVPSLSVLGNISRTFEEMRVALRDHVLATDPASRAAAREAFTTRQGELVRLLRQYADGLVSDERDRRLLDEFRVTHAEWTSEAEALMSLSESGRRETRLVCRLDWYLWTTCSPSIRAFISGESASYAAYMFTNCVSPPFEGTATP